jgi:hypothetical protein
VPSVNFIIAILRPAAAELPALFERIRPFEDLMSEEAWKGSFQGKTTIILWLWELEILDVEIGRHDGMG